MPNAVALVGEYTPRRLRVLMVLMVTNGFNVGAVVGGLVATGLVQDYGWRSVFYVGGTIPLVIGVFMFLGFRNRCSFLFCAAARRQKSRVGSIASTPQRGLTPARISSCENRKPKVCRFLKLFSSGRSAGTLMLWVINFMNLLNLYFMASWLPTIVNEFFSLQASQLVGTTLQVGGVIGTLVFSWFIGRLGFIPVLATAFFTACVSIALIGQPGLAVTVAVWRSVYFRILHCRRPGGRECVVRVVLPHGDSIHRRGVGVGNRPGGRHHWAIYRRPGFVGAGWTAREIFITAAVPALISAITMISFRWVMKPQQAERLRNRRSWRTRFRAVIQPPHVLFLCFY